MSKSDNPSGSDESLISLTDTDVVQVGEASGNQGLNSLIISKKQFTQVNQLLELLRKKTNASAIVLADISGLVIARDSEMSQGHLSTLSALAAANYAATWEMAGLVGEKVGFKANYLEGDTHNLYVGSVDNRFILVVVFTKDTTFGLVRVVSIKALEKLGEILSEEEIAHEKIQAAQPEKKVDEEGFEEELTARLDSILSSDK